MNNLNFFVMQIPWVFFNHFILAYIDPGTGSIIIQAVIATVVGIGVVVKLFWHRILKFLGIRKSITSNDDTKTERDKQ